MVFNFNIIDESVDDTPVTKEQIAAEIEYDTERKFPLSSQLSYITVQILNT